MKPTIWTLDSKMRTWRPPLLAEIWDRAPLCCRDFTALTMRQCGYRICNWCIWRKIAAGIQCPSVTSRAVHTVCCSRSIARSQLRIQRQSRQSCWLISTRPTHTLSTPQNLPQPPSLHAGPSPTWPSQTITFKGNHLACALSFFGLRYVVAAAVASTLPPTILPPNREQKPAITNRLRADTGCLRRLTLVLAALCRSVSARLLTLASSYFLFFLRRLPKSCVPVGRVSAPRQPPVIFVGKGISEKRTARRCQTPLAG